MLERLDSFKHVGLRKRMVELIKSLGYTDLAVLAALNKVPRHLFMDVTLEEMAYQDKALPIGQSQTISAPSMVALQTSLLNLTPGEKVLEIGTGSGYQAAVLIEMGIDLYSIERQNQLHLKTKELFKKMGYKAELLWGDGFEGWPEKAPFDKIIITAGTTIMPHKLIKQLKVGGVMVVPLGHEHEMRVARLVRNSLTTESIEYFSRCAFVPMLPGVVDK